MDVDDDEVVPGGEEQQKEQTEPTTEEVEAEARALGWVPETEFKGKKDHWIEAADFVERGRHLMPVLISNNKRLLDQVKQRDRQIDTLKEKVDNTLKGVERLDKLHKESTKRQLEDQEKQLRAELLEAREDKNIDREEEIREQLDTVKEAKKDLDKVPVKAPEPKTGEVSPEFKEWAEDNPWFQTDATRRNAAIAISDKLRADGSSLVGREFLDEVVRVLEEQEEEKKQRRATSRVEPSAANGRSGGGSKSFEALPADAKRACDDDEETFVGPTKLFKDRKSWREYYAKTYWE